MLKQEVKYLSVNQEEKEKVRQESIKMDQILRDASTQRIQYIHKNQEQAHPPQ